MARRRSAVALPGTSAGSADAHSPQKLAREATLFDAERSYPGIYHALKDRDPARFIGTLEFYPEEGKYHYDGHRSAGRARLLEHRQSM
tara:strand:+ start:90 stop:353 length:264 start_codon:yes stop_codon:yes gene_type:complete